MSAAFPPDRTSVPYRSGRSGRGSSVNVVELRAVRAWHPNPSKADANELVCPVYDTLSENELERFSHRSFNAAGFVPRPKSLPLDRFVRNAVGHLGAALRAGAYIADERPGLYVYGIRYVPPPDILETIEPAERRAEYLLLGLVGCLDFGRIAHGEVALHERVFDDRVDERVALTDATGMSFAPILAGYHLPDHHLNERLEALLGLDRRGLSFEGSVPPLIEATLDGTTHRLWRIDSPRDVEELQGIARALRLLILDGHHRFTAAARRFHAGRASFPLTMLVDGTDRALRVLPWHRVVPASVAAPSELQAGARREFSDVVDLDAAPTPEAALGRLRAMHRAGHRGFLLSDGQTWSEVRGPASDDVGADFDLLHEFLEGRQGIDPHEMVFVRSPRLALESVRSEGGKAPAGTALLLPPLTEKGIEERAFGRGTVMAHKSTMFLPKVAEGMIFAPADGRG